MYVALRISDYLKTVFMEKFNSKPEVIASAPGRLDFLNTHQDYKGLPVVSVAINKRTYVAVSVSNTTRVVSINLCRENLPCIDELDARNPVLLGKGWFGDYIRSVLVTLKNIGANIRNFNMLIYSEIPVASGLASSAALQVAAIKALSEIFDIKLGPREIAELAYRSEHDVMGIPCGRLDQYGSAMGGITLIETKPPYNTETFMTTMFELVAVNSGIRHSTGLIHPIRIRELAQGLKELLTIPDLPSKIRTLISEDIYDTNWAELELNEIEPFLSSINQVSRKRILFTLKMHKSTVLALDLIKNPSGSTMSRVEEFLNAECSQCLDEASKTNNQALRFLGGIINYQHVLLRDLYDVSTPELEEIRRRALMAGGVGVKISGAGLGGAMLVVVDKEIDGTKVVKEVENISAGAWKVEIDRGVRTEEN
ncbi:MAG: galactokinase family protein [Desulfurococcaceae archaeon]